MALGNRIKTPKRALSNETDAGRQTLEEHEKEADRKTEEENEWRCKYALLNESQLQSRKNETGH